MVASDDTLDYFTIELDGAKLPGELVRDVLQVAVDVSLHLPSMFELHVRDEIRKNAFRWIDSGIFRIGTRVKIFSSPARRLNGNRPSSIQLILSEITSLECEFGHGRAATLVVRGYDLGHRLHRGVKTVTYRDMTDFEIVQKVASAAGLEVVGDKTDVVHAYVLQNNITDMEFLRQRARKVGFGVMVDETGKLVFRREPRAKSLKHAVVWGADLDSFSTRVTASRQVIKVDAHGWDVKARVPIHSTATSSTRLEQGDPAILSEAAAAREAFDPPSALMLMAPLLDGIKEGELWAQSIRDLHQRDFLQAEGRCAGHPAVRAGCRLAIAGVGEKYSGEYLVTSATHRFTTAEGYVTQFSVSGGTADTLLHAIEGDRRLTTDDPSGVVIGVVTNNSDPERWGRVKVKFPWLGDAPEIESNWCRVVAPMTGGSGCGAYFIPEIDDEVLVAFEHGDPNAPYVLGCLWNGVDVPPRPSDQVVQNGLVTQRIIRSRSGHQVVLDDSSGAEKIVIVDKTGKERIEFDAARNALTIEAKGGDCTIRCANMKLEADATFALEAGKISIGAQATVGIDGKQVAINKTSLVVL